MFKGKTNAEKLEELQAFLGEENFLKLAERYAGKRLYIPKKRVKHKMNGTLSGKKKGEP